MVSLEKEILQKRWQGSSEWPRERTVEATIGSTEWRDNIYLGWDDMELWDKFTGEEEEKDGWHFMSTYSVPGPVQKLY